MFWRWFFHQQSRQAQTYTHRTKAKEMSVLKYLPSFFLGILFGGVITYYSTNYYMENRALAAYAKSIELAQESKEKEAVYLLNQAIGADPENYRVYLKLGTLYEKMGARNMAISHYQKSFDLMEKNASSEKMEMNFLKDRIQDLSGEQGS